VKKVTTMFFLALVLSFSFVSATEVSYTEEVAIDHDFEKVFGPTFTNRFYEGDLMYLGSPTVHYQEELRMGENTILATSLTSSEPDYNKYVYLEVQEKGDVSLTLALDGRVNLRDATRLTPYSFHFMGKDFSLIDINGDNEFTVVVNSVEYTIRDGDAFFNEDTDNPKWIWRLENLGDYEGQIIKVENYFVLDHLSEDSITLEDCLSFPNNYIEICLDRSTVNTFAIIEAEFDPAADLSEVNPRLSSVPAIHLNQGGGNQPLRLSESLRSYPGVIMNPSFTTTDTSQIWIYTPEGQGLWIDGSPSVAYPNAKWVGIFYKKTNIFGRSRIEFYAHVDLLTNNYDFTRSSFYNTDNQNVIIGIEKSEEANGNLALYIEMKGDNLGDTSRDSKFTSNWGLTSDNGQIASLGKTKYTAEPNQVVWESSPYESYFDYYRVFGNVLPIGDTLVNQKEPYGAHLSLADYNAQEDRVKIIVPEDQEKILVRLQLNDAY
jgi:hypothetical protein